MITPAEREERRAETMRTLARMAGLPPGAPERARLRAEVIEDHMPYARHIAGHYGRSGVADEDFAQVAYLGLVKAVDNFDPERGAAFLGYATPVIVGEIKRYFRDATWDVHVPRRMQEVTGALRRAEDVLTARLGREPTVAQLAEHLGVEADEVVEALDAAGAYSTASLDRPVGAQDDGATLGETIGRDDPGFGRTEDRAVLSGLVAGLCDRDRHVLLMRFFRGMTQAEIAAELGVSQMQVSRLITKVLGRLREGFG